MAATLFTPSYTLKTSCLRTMGKKTNTTLRNTMKKCRRSRNSPIMRMATARICTRLETILPGGLSRRNWPRFTSIVITWSKSFQCFRAVAPSAPWFLLASTTKQLYLRSLRNQKWWKIVSMTLGPFSRKVIKKIQTCSLIIIQRVHQGPKHLIHRGIVSIRLRWIRSMAISRQQEPK